MSIECEAPIDPFSKSNNISQRIHEMAPFQESPQRSQQNLDSDLNMQGIHQQDSRVSSPTSSLGSSSPSPNLDTSNEYPVDLSSDDSSCMTSEYYSGQGREHSLSDPLHELQNSLTRNGFLGQSLTNGLSSVETGARSNSDAANRGIDSLECHMCSFKASSTEEYSRHIDSHFEHKCPICDYTSRTEGRLSRHIQDFHSQVPPESWAGRKKSSPGKNEKVNTETSSSNTPKAKLTKCKQCNFTCDSKPDYYKHLQEAHLKKEKILNCPKCCFVTEYKHHFEYHLRNHFGSKPFKCTKCNYICVNKSMLNSHKKSHSKFFPYRCANCKYATKYCHSLKVHLRKYDHKPGQVLNPDGTPNEMPIIDVYGRRRGPKDKSTGKSKTKSPSSKNKSNGYPMSSSSDERNAIHSQPFMYPSHYFPGNPFPAMLMAPPASVDVQMPPFPIFPGKPFKCYYCEFITDSRDMYQQHLVAHAARENSDLIRTCNINPDVFHVQAQHLTFNNYPQNAIHYSENSPKILSKDNTLPATHINSTDSNATRNLLNSSLSVAASNTPSNILPTLANSFSTSNTSSAASNVKQFSASSLTNNNTEFQSPNENFPLHNNVANSKILGNNFSHSTVTQQDSTSERKSLVSNSSVFSPSQTKINDFEMTPDNLKVCNTSQEIPPPEPLQKAYECIKEPYQDYDSSFNKSELQASSQEPSAFSRCSPFSDRSVASNSSQPIEKSFQINEQTDNYSPLDLSNTKSNSPTETNGKDCSSSQRSDASLSESSPQSSDGFSSQSRNRRKGKAFKLDHYIQCAESPLRVDMTGPIDSPKDNARYAKNNSAASFPDTRSFNQQSYSKEVEELDMTESNNMAPIISKIKEFIRLENSSQTVRRQRLSSSPRHFESDYYGQERSQRNQEDGYRTKVGTPTVTKIEQDTTETLTDSPDDGYICNYCEMVFRNCAMYTMHMGFHGYGDPYTCNKCGSVCHDKVEFFLHLMRTSHT